MILNFVFMLKLLFNRFFLCFFAVIFCFKTGLSQIDTVKIFGNESLLQSLYKNSNKNDYTDCEVLIGQNKIAAKVRVRGDSSRDFDKKSLKIKFETDGVKKVLNLNAEYKDKSYMHQYMAAFIFRKSGIPTFSTHYKVVVINNKFEGIYLQVENVDEDFLKRNKLDHNGNLYKAKKDGSNLSVYDEVNYRWQKKTNTNHDKKDLNDLIINLNQVPDSGFLRFIKTTFDYNNLITAIALNSLTGNGSTYYHNYFLFHDISESGKWMYFPWDMDKSMGSFDTRLPYYYTSWSYMTGGGQPENPLVYRLLHDKKGLKDYKKKVKELSKTIFSAKELLPEIELLKKKLTPYIDADKRDAIGNVKSWEDAVKKMIKYIDEKPKALENQLAEYPSLFCLNNEPGYQFDKTAKLRWENSKTNKGSVIYHVKISPSKTFKNDVLEFNDLKENKLEIENLKPGRYYWHVVADNGKFKVNGFNTRNYFDVGKAVILGGKINGKKILKNTEVVIFKDLKIGKHDTLIFGEGVIVKVNPQVRIFNKGVLKIIGTEKTPVILSNRKKEKAWLGIFSTGTLEVSYAYFSGIKGESVIRQIEGTAKMQNTLSQYNKVRETASFNICPVVINNNIVKHSKGEGILLLKCSGIVKNNSLFGIPDAIEATHCKDLTITENFIIDASDDGIDVNFGSNIHVNYNTAINCKDKGMSVSGNEHDSTIFFEGNYIQDCTRGIGIEGKGVVNLIGNIYYNNKKQLFLENIKGLTVYSRGEYFNTTKTIDPHVNISDQKTFTEQYLEGLQVKMKVDMSNKKVWSISLFNEHSFPISLKGLSIKSGKKILYHFNHDEIVFPLNEIVLHDRQLEKLFNRLVMNDVKAKKTIKSEYNNKSIKKKHKKKKQQNYWLYISTVIVVVSIIGFLIVKKKN